MIFVCVFICVCLHVYVYVSTCAYLCAACKRLSPVNTPPPLLLHPTPHVSNGVAALLRTAVHYKGSTVVPATAPTLPPDCTRIAVGGKFLVNATCICIRNCCPCPRMYFNPRGR